MLTVTIQGSEFFDEDKELFIYAEPTTLELEHSLVSLSKWESLWEKPFLSPDKKTTEETLSYIQMMSLAPNTPAEVFLSLSDENLTIINAYIAANMTATWFSEAPGGPPTPKHPEVITAEIIYYWMATFQIPFECEKWHLNRLITLVKVCNEKNAPEKETNQQEMLEQRHRLNQQRLAQMGTSG